MKATKSSPDDWNFTELLGNAVVGGVHGARAEVKELAELLRCPGDSAKG